MTLTHKHLNRTAIAVFALAVIVGGLTWYRVANGRFASDKAQLDAPAIALSPENAGTLEELLVQPGDRVGANEVVARVGTELVKAKVDGEVIAVTSTIGTLVNRGEPVVTMIDRHALRVVVRVKEDKGLQALSAGQIASFTVDAFPGKTYTAVVDEVAPTSREAGVLFSISDKRETKEFDVKLRFDADAYPELKHGMSAKAVVYLR